jgi:hypothetical protein
MVCAVQYVVPSRRFPGYRPDAVPAYLGGVTLFPEEFSRLGAGLEHEQNYRHIANTHLRSEIGLLQEPCKLIVLQRDIRHMDPQISTDKYFFGTS